MNKVLVIDTSYLLELFEVPGFSSFHHVGQVKERFRSAINGSAIFIVPLPCIFEVGNHIAGVHDGAKRNTLAEKLNKSVIGSIKDGAPWVITPSCGLDDLEKLLLLFQGEHVISKIGLTDSFTIHEARRLKAKYNQADYKIHIWTKDNSLKAQEPDTENNPFIG